MVRQLSTEELRARLDRAAESLVLLDVREAWEFEVCHIAGSRSIPMSQLLGRLREIQPGHPTVVICHHGVRSQRVAAYLAQAGFANVMNLVGGVDGWARSVEPSMPIY